MTETGCQCNEEYGPCEDHADVLVIREGASLHTADELTMLLVEDLIQCGAKFDAKQKAEHCRLDDALTNAYDPATGTAWFSEDTDRDDALALATEIESSADGLYVVHEDGYVISRPHADCPLI